MSTKKRSRADGTTTGAGQKRVPVEKADDLDIVLAKCRELKTALRQKDMDGAEKVIPESVKSEEILEVVELSATEVLEGIEGVALTIAKQVLSKQGFTMDVPSRSASNQIYVKEWDRIVLGGKRSTRSFMNVRVRSLICGMKMLALATVMRRCTLLVPKTSLCSPPSLLFSQLPIYRNLARLPLPFV